MCPQGTKEVGGITLARTLGVDGDDVPLIATPLFHGNGWGALATTLAAGATMVFDEEFHASRFWDRASGSGATVLFTLGTVLAMLLNRPAANVEARHKLRLVMGAGAASIADLVSARLGVDHLVECYGSTEASMVTITPLGERHRPGSAGKVAPGVDVQIWRGARAVPPGEIGEIVVRPPAPHNRYVRTGDLRETTDGWHHSGDLGWLDDDSWLYFVDRQKDVIRHRSENVLSVRVERAIAAHPDVLDVAVIGVPHAVYGQEIKACIVLAGSVRDEELAAFVAPHLARFEIPTIWERRDALPKTATQRTAKHVLRQELQGDGRPALA
jgi:crotonobetaine/carnitine-CoA ligase